MGERYATSSAEEGGWAIMFHILDVFEKLIEDNRESGDDSSIEEPDSDVDVAVSDWKGHSQAQHHGFYTLVEERMHSNYQRDLFNLTID